MKKILSLGLIGVLSASLMVGCSSEFDSTEYLNNSGKQALEVLKNEDREYKKIDSLTILGEVEYKDQYVSIVGKVDDIKLEDNLMAIWLDADCNESPYPIKIYIPKNMIDVKFNKGDIITAKGRFNKLAQKYKDDKDLRYWHINAYFLELGDTTNNDTKNTKESISDNNVVDENPSPKKTTANISDEESEQATSKSDNKTTQTVTKDTSQKEITQEKSASKEKTTTKNEEPKKKGYWVTCPNGHKVYTENGDYDCVQCYDDYMNQQEGNEDNNDDDNIDDETGLAKVKDGTHLREMNPDDDIEAIEDPEYYE